jgi:hypothetical protein
MMTAIFPRTRRILGGFRESWLLAQVSLLLSLGLALFANPIGAQEINVRGYFGTTIPSGQVNATGSNGSFLGTLDSIDSAPITRTFTIENTASQFEILTLTGSPKVNVGGPHADDFTVAQPSAIGILGGNSTTFQVTFTPGAGGFAMPRSPFPTATPTAARTPTNLPSRLP